MNTETSLPVTTAELKKNTRKRVNWTGVDINRSVSELAMELGCSESAVHQRRAKVRRENGDTTHRKMRYDWAKIDIGNRNPFDIAAEIGCHPQAVYYQRQKQGIRGRVSEPRKTAPLVSQKVEVDDNQMELFPKS